MEHEERVQAAEDAIERVFSDRTVSPSRTAESLRALAQTIEDKLAVLPGEDDDDDNRD